MRGQVKALCSSRRAFLSALFQAVSIKCDVSLGLLQPAALFDDLRCHTHITNGGGKVLS